MNAIVELSNVAVVMEESGRTDLTLTVEAGTFVGLIGPSRSGKSLILKLCAGTVEAESGTVRLFGQDFDKLDDDERAVLQQRVGMVLQHPGLLSNMTVFNNIALPLRYHRPGDAPALKTTVMTQLEALGLTRLAQKFPAQLMPGEARCAAIARALVLEPGLLLLDDPVAGLDADMVARLTEVLNRHQRTRGLTILAALRTFSPLLGASGRIAFVRNGEVEATGSHAELLALGEPALSAYLS
jgi:ABC-type transporter Mla maintaining outer membrane lipid asymmetry ATPase subunit MlaF